MEKSSIELWTIFARFRLVWYVGLLKVPSHTLLIDWLRCLRISEQEMLIVGPPTCGYSCEIYGRRPPRVGLFEETVITVHKGLNLENGHRRQVGQQPNSRKISGTTTIYHLIWTQKIRGFCLVHIVTDGTCWGI